LVLLIPKNLEQEEQGLPEAEAEAVTGIENRSGISLQKKLIAFIVSFAIFLLLWQLVANESGNSLIVAGPLPVFQSLVNLLQNHIPLIAQGAETADTAILQTLEVIVLGFALSVIVGIPIGITAGLYRSVGEVVEPWVSVVYSIPIVALVPVIYYGIGASFTADVFIAFLFSVFTIIINTQNGVRYMSNSLAEVGRTYGATSWQFVTKIVVPASTPDMVTGMRIAIGRAILGAVLAEALLPGTGLGSLMMIFQATFSTSYMMAAVVLIAIMGILVLQLPKILEHRLFKWKETERLARM
jgi:ABC-type nitrate/sulfonate/bicarbonate transport system permease component